MIKKLWRMLVGGCDHKWKQIEMSRVFADGAPDDSRPIAVLYALQCKHCGNIKARKIRP